VQSTAQAHEAQAQLTFERSYPPTVNHTREAQLAATVGEEVLGPENVRRDMEPTMGAEDFSFFLRQCPGAYLFLGNGTTGSHRSAGHGAGPCTLHNASYDFNDDLIPIGASFWVRLVERYLSDA